MTRHSFKTRWIGRYDSTRKIYRIAKAVWQRGNMHAEELGAYSAKLTVALSPQLFEYQNTNGEVIMKAFGIRFHYQRSYGGIHV